MHTLHRGRGRYIIIHVDEKHGEETARIENFVVGHDIHKGERLQWMVEGGKYKASFLLPDHEDDMKSEGLLISEVYTSWGRTPQQRTIVLTLGHQTVVPGFEFSDHDFMPASSLPELVSEAQAKELQWLLSKSR